MWNFDILLEILAAFAGTIGYGALFNVRGKKLLFAGLGGMFGWIIYLLLNIVISNEIICCLIVAIITSAYSEVLARILKTPATTFYIATLMPLIPGSALYYSIDAAVGGDMQGFINHISRTVYFAAALSAGIIVANTIARNINPRKIKK